MIDMVEAAARRRGRVEARQEANDEARLVARLATGDGEALLALYDRHSGAAYAAALALSRDPHEAEDLVQEAFMALLQHARDFDARRGSVRTWLLAIVRHRALDLLRSARMRRETGDGEAAVLAARDAVEVEGEAIRRCESLALRAALATLPAPQRQAIELAYFGGYSYPEIAAKLGLPVGTVKSRLRLALQRLRGAIELRGLEAVG